MPKATPQRPWLAWYSLARWEKKAREHKRHHPVCVMCDAKGLIAPAEVADHVIPHKGDYRLFWFGALQSLCTDCHNRDKQQIETRGYTTDVGADGWPTDPRHPVNAKK